MPPRAVSGFHPASELRQDLVSGEWVAIATERAKRPGAFARKTARRSEAGRKTCPFERLLPEHVLAYTSKGGTALADDWWVQAAPNKYPAFTRSTVCARQHEKGPYRWTEGVGFHEVIITRDHARSMALMSGEEVEQVVRIYQERAVVMGRDDCTQYTSIFHNHGAGAGATLAHPHSQIIAIPVIPPDVGRSIQGAAAYFARHNACVHCAAIEYELGVGERIIYENEHCVVVAPYASKSAFETRIFPRKHRARFEETAAEERRAVADALRIALAKLFYGLNDPDYNFFFHTAPGHDGAFAHYHWHVEIVPKTAIWAGFEIGTGIEISAIRPEDAAAFLRTVELPHA